MAMAAHTSKASIGGTNSKNVVSSKGTDSLVSVSLSGDSLSGEAEADLITPIPHEQEITMHFPDDIEIARSSLGATEDIPLTPAEEPAAHSGSIMSMDLAKSALLEDGTSIRTAVSPEDQGLSQTSEADHEEEVKPVPDTTDATTFEKTPHNHSQRASKVRFDLDQDKIDIPLDLKTEAILDQEDDVSSRVTSRSDAPDTVLVENPMEAELARGIERSRRASDSGSESDGELVDWQELDRTEVEEKRDGATGESMAFLLARLEKENNALATDPKANLTHGRRRKASRPPSLHMIKKLVNEPTKPQLRYSLLPTPPPMTELEFWSALVRDYPSTAQRLPTLTSNKIRSGIPPPLRGVVWQSIAGARDQVLEDEYVRLSVESSPYEKMIHKDVGRSFPGVDMFRDPNGQGQRMLSKVLNAFSLWDQEIGYCQGLGFVVGPLLMHMGDKEAFCVLVRLMEHYDLRSCFLPSLRGLHLRIYQFQNLLSQHLPELTAHLERLKVEPLYLSQWFLSFFGVTCPLPMLIRIYDVILTEGASETLMRVALSLMRRNAPKILATNEFEDVMHLLLSRSLWDTYGTNADDLVDDFVGWTGLVTREGLEKLEASFREKEQSNADKPGVHSAASRFLGRFWTGNNVPGKTMTAPTLSMPVKNSQMQRTPSKQSMASTLNSVESSDGHQSTGSTTATTLSQEVMAEDLAIKQSFPQSVSSNTRTTAHQDKDLHTQIEDLLIALSNLQREHSALADDLQQEREQREEDKAVVLRALANLKVPPEPVASSESVSDIDASLEHLDRSINGAVADLEAQFTASSKRSSLTIQTKQQLREDVLRWKNMYAEEVSRTAALTTQLNDKDREAINAREELKQARGRIADSHREQQRLEKVNQDLKLRKSVSNDAVYPTSPIESPRGSSPGNGLRELRLGRGSTASSLVAVQTPISRRASSLMVKEVLATEDHKPPSEDALLHELVNAKTAEAVARQELEEVKAKLDSLRKLMNLSTSSAPSHAHNASISSVKTIPVQMAAKQEPKKDTGTPSSYTASSFFSGWGKRTTSGSG